MPGPVPTASATTQPDVVEVLRGTAASDAAVTAAYAGAVAAAAVIVAVVALVRRARATDGDSRALSGGGSATGAVTGVMLAAAAVSLLATTIELTLLMIDGASVGDRRPLVAMARMLASVGIIAGQRLGDADPLAGPVRWTVALAGIVTVPLGAPALRGLGALGVALAVTVAAAALAWLGLALCSRARPRLAPALSLLVVAALGVPAGLVLAPEQVPPYQRERVVADGIELDVTVAPLTPGTNELHLYAWDSDGGEAAIEQATVEVVGHADSRHRLLAVSPGHHLSYALELPPGEQWDLVLDCHTADGRELSQTLSLEVP